MHRLLQEHLVWNWPTGLLGSIVVEYVVAKLSSGLKERVTYRCVARRVANAQLSTSPTIVFGDQSRILRGVSNVNDRGY